MRLLRTDTLDADTLEFEEFFGHNIPEYAILSHRWDSTKEEVSYNEFLAGSKRDTTGYAKIRYFAALAKTHKFEYCWVDTCCIDKSSSAELSEAINSMYLWYQRANSCFAYLRDVDSRDSLVHSEWFRRGWTLQELIAPKRISFFNYRWSWLGERADLAPVIYSATGIHVRLLGAQVPHVTIKDYSIAQIMSWAASRKTSRLEDEAYCLMGLFGVNMPLLYGEGANAFQRLQQTIIARSGDYSIFAWGLKDFEYTLTQYHFGVLAPDPSAFRFCANVVRTSTDRRILFDVTNEGIMVLIHRSYDSCNIDKLLQSPSEFYNGELGLMVPLGCTRQFQASAVNQEVIAEPLYLLITVIDNEWHPVEVRHCRGFPRHLRPQTKPLVYTNDYVRLYIYHHKEPGWMPVHSSESLPTEYLRLGEGTRWVMDGTETAYRPLDSLGP